MCVTGIFLCLFLIFVPSLPAQDKLIVSLPQAIELALEKNRAIIQSKNFIDVNRLNLGLARSDFDPKIIPSAGVGVTDGDEDLNVGASVTKRFTQGVELALTPRMGKGSDSYSGWVGLSLGIPLFKGGGLLTNMDAVYGAEFTLRSAQRTRHKTITNIIVQTVDTFYSIIGHKKKVEMNSFLVQRFQDHAALAQLKSDIGLAGPLDVYRAVIKIRDAESDLSSALELLQNEKYNLKSILSIPQDNALEVEDDPIEVEAVGIGVDEAERVALAKNIAIFQAKDVLGETQRESLVARHNLRPDLKLNIDYSRGGESYFLSDSLSLDEETWRVFLTTSTDFSRTREKISYQQSLVGVDSARIDLNNIKDEVRKNVRSQIDTLAKAEEQIDIRKQQIHQAEGKKVLSEVKFNNDMADNFDLIEAETELHVAKINLLNAKIDYLVGVYRLREIMGTLLEYHEK